MNDRKQQNTVPHKDYAELVRNQQLLAAYIQTSLWDEEMNRRREYWLWERKGVYPKTNQ